MSRCPLRGTGFDCDLQRRIVAAQRYVDGRPGTVGIVVRDRRTGAMWRNGYADTEVWTASTIKLAMTVDLLTRDRAGLISLTATDRAHIRAMLHVSDDDAADALWFRYAGVDHFAYNNRFPAYGMTTLRPQKGFTDFYPYWGFQKCTPADLDRLMQYVLARLNPADRDYVVAQMRSVGSVQQWGVWGAGAAAQPGNKDGWSEEQGGWVINTVGFVGPSERYTLAIMNSLNRQGGYDDGVTTDSRVAALLFGGRF
ncbi:MAG: tat pathway signal sequence [bacterium]